MAVTKPAIDAEMSMSWAHEQSCDGSPGTTAAIKKKAPLGGAAKYGGLSTPHHNCPRSINRC